MNRLPIQSVARPLALFMAAALAGQAHAEAGRIEFAFGGGTVRNAQGARPMARGLEVESGDTVQTTDGRAQIRFKDGAFVSLQPNTEFAIRDYKFDGKTDGSERGVFGLAKGTVRAVTGLIGRVNREAFSVVTPTATVGIRGTGGLLAVGPDGSTRIIGTAGVWTLTNRAGTVDVPAGSAALAPSDQNTAPQRTSEAPQAPPAPVAVAAQVPISKAEERTASGVSAAGGNTNIGTSAGVPLGVIFADVKGGTNSAQTAILESSSNAQFTGTVTGLVGPAGTLSGFTYKESFQGTTSQSDYRFTGTLLENGTDGGVGWGRWIGPASIVNTQGNGSTTTTNTTYPVNGGFHYVYGNPTVQMPTTGQFTYNLLAATGPTIKDASLPQGTVTSGQLSGSFTPTGGGVSVSLGLGFNGKTYSMLTSGTISGSTFFASGSSFGSGCVNNCSAFVQGGFFGVGATHAGVTYSADTSPGTNQISGVAVFKR